MTAAGVPDDAFVLTPLADSDWRIVSPFVVRATGFPAGTLTDLSGPEQLDDAAFDAELQRAALRMVEFAGTEAFREALAWQNAGTLVSFASLARDIETSPRNVKRRDRERRLLRYIARYCGKTETIGFFGPLGWGAVAGAGHIRQRPGATLIGRRQVFAESWSVRALASALAADERIRPWLPLRVRTHFAVRDGLLLRPRQEAVPLTATETEVIGLCDGERPRRRVVETTAASLGLPIDEIEACVSDLEGRRFLVTDANLPHGPEALDVLRRRTAAIADPEAGTLARELLDRHRVAVAALEKARGDAVAVCEAQQELADVFEDLTGGSSERKPGMMYAGRGLVYEDCLRNLDVEVGAAFLERLEDAMPAVMTISRWLTSATAAAYERHFAEVWQDGRVRGLDDVWFTLLAAFFGARSRPVDTVLEEFSRRWGQLLAETARHPDGAHDAEGFRAGAEKLFDASRPGWKTAGIHSPDLQICSLSRDGAESGDYSIVLGEVHVASATPTGPVFEWPYEGYPVSQFLQDRCGPRYVPVYPDTWPRNTGRTKAFQTVPGDVLYAFADVEGAPAGTLSIAAITVAAADGAVTVTLPDGSRVAFAEFFNCFLSAVVIDAWKRLSRGPHTDRVTVGGVTVLRESWRFDVSEEPFLRATGELAGFRAVQEWRRSVGLPDAVYASLAGETKPFHVDFLAPLSVLSFLVAARAALRGPQGSGKIAFSEALPSPEQAWAADAQGRRYLGEIRMLLVDDRM
jgi:hypothetical protein